MDSADQNKWNLRLDDSVPLDFPSTLPTGSYSWEAEVEGFFEPSPSLARVLAKTMELQLEPSRTWWQRIIPISHVYIMRSVKWDHTPEAGEPATYKVTGEVDSGTEGPKMYWQWRIPGWARGYRRIMGAGLCI